MNEALLPNLTTEERKMARKQRTPRVAHGLTEILSPKTTNLPPELALDDQQFARYAVSVIPAHLLGTAVGPRNGSSPDAPKNLTLAVIFPSNGKTPAKRSGA